MIAVMHDDTVVTKDFTPEPQDRLPIYWFDSYKTVQLANLVLCIELATGATEVLKNRWGSEGRVVR
jgi:hypothetical protein